MRRSAALALLLAFTVSGCMADDANGNDDGDDGRSQDTDNDRPGYREGVVFHNEEYSVSSVQPATFSVQVEAGAREVILEIQQESGVLPNLHVELTGCGEVDPPASGGWQAYPLCDTAEAGTQTLTISVRSGGPSGNGRALLRADLPS